MYGINVSDGVGDLLLSTRTDEWQEAIDPQRYLDLLEE